jgi:Predicted ornithine cyclodeaminase, mu-crystallin homolog
LLILSKQTLERLFNAEEALNALSLGYKHFEMGLVSNPERSVITKENDWWGVMLAHSYETGVCVKAVSVLPNNAKKGAPVTQALVIYHNALNGEPLALIEGTTFTALRTACVSALALKLLIKPEGVFFVGTGLQARYHAFVLKELFDIKEVNARSKTTQSRESFLSYCANLGLKVNSSLKEEDAQTVIVATTSNVPVIERFGEKNKIIVSIGAPTPSARELSDQVLKKADYIVVDSYEGCLKEAGDIIQPLSAGLLKREKIVSLGELVTSKKSASGKIVYKSVGIAFQDLYIAKYFFDKAQKEGVGQNVSLV